VTRKVPTPTLAELNYLRGNFNLSLMTLRLMTFATCLIAVIGGLPILSLAQSNDVLPTMTHTEVEAYHGPSLSLSAYVASNGQTYRVGDVLALSSPEDMIRTRVDKKTGLTYFLYIHRSAFFFSSPASHDFLGPTLTIEDIWVGPVGDKKRGKTRPSLVTFLSSKGKRAIFVAVEASLENRDFTLLESEVAD